MTTRRSAAFVVFFLLLFLAACCPDGGLSIVSDPEENAVFTSPPRRVVSLYPTASEILTAPGTAGSVEDVAIHSAGQSEFENKNYDKQLHALV